MSSYLSIYIVPKRKSDKEEKKHILLAASSRNTELYQYFSENIHPVFACKEDSYTTITKESIREVVTDLSNDISNSKDRLAEYEKYAKDNPDYIQEIIELKQYISDLQYTQGKVAFIEDMIDGIDFYKVIEEVCCNID